MVRVVVTADEVIFWESGEFCRRRRQSRRQQRREIKRAHRRFLPCRETNTLREVAANATAGTRNDASSVHSIAAVVVCALATPAAAQYPDRPIHLIVPQAAGSATDTVARILAAPLTQEIGQQIIVDDRPGGALTVGLDLTAKAAPDGYTMCLGPIGALAISPHLVKDLPYDIARDFQPIALVMRGQLYCWRCRRRRRFSPSKS